jgi:hypothetical protein
VFAEAAAGPNCWPKITVSRGIQVYRSTVWRTRLDNTTNWAVVKGAAEVRLTAAPCQQLRYGLTEDGTVAIDAPDPKPNWVPCSHRNAAIHHHSVQNLIF